MASGLSNKASGDLSKSSLGGGGKVEADNIYTFALSVKFVYAVKYLNKFKCRGKKDNLLRIAKG